MAGGVLVALALAAVGLFWLGGREATLRWVIAQVAQATGGHITAEGIHGSLYDRIDVDRLDYRDEGKQVLVLGATIRWTLLEFARTRHLTVSRLEAREVRVVLPPSEKPASYPATLQLPFTFDIPEARIGTLRIVRQQGETPLTSVGFTLRYDHSAYRLQGRLGTPWGDASASAGIAAVPPFSLTGSLGLKNVTHGLQATLGLTGELARLSLALDARARSASVRGSALLTPFAAVKVARATFHGTDIDPGEWRAGLPSARLSAKVDLSGREGETFEGPVSVENAEPGSLDRDRLPLHRLAGQLRGNAEQVSLDGLRLDLGVAGRLDGRARWKDGKAELNLDARGVNLRGLHRRLVATGLSGPLTIASDGTRTDTRARLAWRGYELTLDAALAGQVVTVAQAAVRGKGGELAVKGTVPLARHGFDLQGALSRFDPAAFGDFPAARLNARFAAAGAWAPQPQARLRFDLADSRFWNQPLTGHGTLSVSPRRVSEADVDFVLAGNRVTAAGSFGAPGDRLEWHLAAPRIAALGTGWAGNASGSGTLQGAFADPVVGFKLQGSELAWPGGNRVASLRADGRLSPGPAGALELNAVATGYHSEQLNLAEARLSARGTRARHTGTLTATGENVAMQAEAAGGWDPSRGWRGTLLQLTNRGRYPVALQGPAPLAVSADRLAFGPARLLIAGGTFDLRSLARERQELSTAGSFAGIPLEFVRTLAPKALSEVKGDLRLRGAWDIRAGRALEGSMELIREQGDLVLLAEDKATPLGLTRLALRGAARSGRLSATLDAEGRLLGRVSAAATSELVQRAGALGIGAASPFTLTADADIASLRSLSPLLPPQLVADGRFSAHVTGSGTIGDPRLSGTLNGDALHLRLPEQELDLPGGELRAEFVGRELRIRSLRFATKDGELRASGTVHMEENAPALDLTVAARSFPIFAGRDRQLVVSGTATTRTEAKHLNIQARLRADRAFVNLGETGGGRHLSPDIVVVGRPAKPEPKPLPYPPRMTLELDLGEQFLVRGRGIDARLEGQVTLRGNLGGVPLASGTVRVVKGTYNAYGQELVIERGVINFAGPIDNPRLDIAATRKNLPVKVGIEVTGTVAAPRVQLVSETPMTDQEKLSWIVLGHGAGTAEKSDLALLQAAAGALLARGGSGPTVQERLSRATGLDQLSLASSGPEGAAVLLGKRLSSQLYLTFERSLTGLATLVKIEYVLTRHITVQAQTGLDNSVDVFYTLSFD